MKIKLTEEQYNRLLVEDDKDFLDGDINFKHIGNKVSPFLVKLFNIINEKCNDCPFDKMTAMIENDFALTEQEATLLTYNYNNFRAHRPNDEWTFDAVLGEPLIYYGKFLYDMEVPVQGIVDGYISGWVEAYATSYEDLLEVLQNGEGEVTADWNDRVDANVHDVDWDVDEDYAIERVREYIEDGEDEDNMEEFLNKVSIG